MKKNMNNSEFIGAIILFILGLLLLCFIIAYPVMILWNNLFPELFGWKTINFSQALQLSVLCSLLFESNNSSSK